MPLRDRGARPQSQQRQPVGRIVAEAILAVLVLPSILTAAASRPSQPDVVVYVLEGILVPKFVMIRAEDIAHSLFQTIGLNVALISAGSHRDVGTAIVLHLRIADTSDSPVDDDVFGYAHPFAGRDREILVLWPRISRQQSDAESVLAHVMAHEVSHVLEGDNWHAKAGIMKGFWTTADLIRMSHKGLPFTPEDAQRIRAGVKRLREP